MPNTAQIKRTHSVVENAGADWLRWDGNSETFKSKIGEIKCGGVTAGVLGEDRTLQRDIIFPLKTLLG